MMAVAFGNEHALMPAVAIALYGVARTGDRRRSLTVSLIVALGMAVAVAAVEGDEPFAQELVGELAIGLLPIAVGDAARARADRLRQLIDTEAAARVQAERLRIARDLHDVVAHGLSIIAVQSGVASHLLDRDPAQARESLDIINATGRQSLEELRSMVGVLRSTDGAPLVPTPADPNDFSAVVDGAARAGVAVTTTVAGAFPADVSDAAVVAVHRILQEALTNVARHAGGAATAVALTHGEDSVTLNVANQAGGPPIGEVPSTGVGIVGMAERAESVGGTLSAGADGCGGFLVEAAIPYNGSRSA